MNRLTYAVVITIGVVMFAIGALAGHTYPRHPGSVGNAYVEQVMPYPLIVKIWDRESQPLDRPY